MNIQCGVAFRGYFRFEATNIHTGKSRVLLDWFPNTVLTVGREQMAQRNDWAGQNAYIHIGTNGALPQPSDPGLLTWFASTNTEQAHSTGVQGSEPFYGWDRVTKRFPSETFGGGENIAEVGVGWGPTNSEVYARTVPVDITGTPTTVSLLEGEVLDVMYELRYYPMLGDTKAIVTIEAFAYDAITRAALVSSPGYQNNQIGQEIKEVSGSNTFYANDGDIGTIEQAPLGASDDLDGTPYSMPYTPFSYSRTIVASCGINGWNVPGGVIRSVVCTTTAGQFQTQFERQSSPTVGFPKATDQSAELRWAISYSAYLFEGTWQRGPDTDTPGVTSQQWNMNIANDILRISWTDALSDSRREELKVPSGTVFHLQNSTGDWIEYEVDGAYTEGADYTEYAVINPAIGASGSAPSSGNVCTIRAVFP
jgi:hypothetical protein